MDIKIEGLSLTSYQRNILFSEARFTICEASTKAGKTHSHILWLFCKSHEYDIADGKNYWWVAPVYNQARIAFKRLKRNLIKFKDHYRFNETALVIYCPNGAEIHFKSAEKPDNLFGEDVYAAVFDEAPRAREDSWFALRSTLTATQAPCKLIGNFGGISNWVHKLKEKSYDDPNYEYFKITCWDAIAEGILSREEVEQAQRDLPTKIFKSLYEAEQSEDDGQLIQNESIRKLFTNEVNGGIKYITADIARLGADKTVIYVWDGLGVVEVKTLNTSTVTQSAASIKSLMVKYNVNLQNVIVDEDGVGGGVKDILKCVGFVNNSKPIKVKGIIDNFSNLKSQCYYKLSEMINANELSVCDNDFQTELMQELEWVRLAKDIDANKITLMSKADIKKKIGRSPDYSDALMMRMYFELNINKGSYAVYY